MHEIHNRFERFYVPKKAEYLSILLDLLHIQMIIFLIYWVNKLLKLSSSLFIFLV